MLEVVFGQVENALVWASRDYLVVLMPVKIRQDDEEMQNDRN